MLHKREYEITNAGIVLSETGVKVLQVSAKITDYLGIRHGEHGEEIPRTKTRTIGVAIPVPELPSTNKKAYVMGKLKTAYKQTKAAEKETKAFVGYKTTENVSS